MISVSYLGWANLETGTLEQMINSHRRQSSATIKIVSGGLLFTLLLAWLIPFKFLPLNWRACPARGWLVLGHVRLTPYSICSASFFSGNSVFLSQQFSRNSVFSQFHPSFRPANGARVLLKLCRLLWEFAKTHQAMAAVYSPIF